MSSTRPTVAVKLTLEELDRLTMTRDAMQARNPEATVTRSDVMRLAIRALPDDPAANAAYALRFAAQKALDPLE